MRRRTLLTLILSTGDKMQVGKEYKWGEWKGKTVFCYSIHSETGESAIISDYGATMISLLVPDRHGASDDIVLGYDTLQEYVDNPKNVGATIGRYANRIAFGRFILDGRQIQVDCNRPPHSIHGGTNGFDKKLWTKTEHSDSRLGLQLVSEDGDQGFPGRLTAEAIFDFSVPHTLRVEYSVETDRKTICSMTNHAYWNLAGHASGRTGCGGQTIAVFSERYLETGSDGVPTGKLLSCSKTAYDLNMPKLIKDLTEDPRLSETKGIDHSYTLSGNMERAAKAEEPKSGRTLEIRTNLPAAQVYLGSNIPEGLGGKNGAVYGPFCAFCVEPQQYPDAPNHPAFPSAVIEPGKRYEYVTDYLFGVMQ